MPMRAEYANEKFIRLLRKNENAETRFVKGSNFVDIGYVIDKRTKQDSGDRRN